MHVDCWACEASRSPAIQGVLKARDAALARAEHAEMVLERAVPDQADRVELWRAHWREQIARRNT